MKTFSKVGLAASLVIVAGCGGSGSFHFVPPDVQGITSTPSTETIANVPVTAPVGTPTSGTFPVNGQQVSAVVPGGQSIAIGDNVVLVPTTFPLPLTTSGAAATRTAGAGEIYEKNAGGPWTDTGLKVQNGIVVGTTGATLPHKFVALAAKNQSLAFYVQGPVNLPGLSGHPPLTVNGNVYIAWDSFGHNAYPQKVTYALPANGGTLPAAKIAVQFKPGGIVAFGAAFLTYGGISKHYTAVAGPDVDGITTFTILDPATDSTDPIPGTGIDNVQVDIVAIQFPIRFF